MQIIASRLVCDKKTNIEYFDYPAIVEIVAGGIFV